MEELSEMDGCSWWISRQEGKERKCQKVSWKVKENHGESAI